MKESIGLLFLILLLAIESDGRRLSLRRKQISNGKCNRMQESRRCPNATRSWHYDIRLSECRISNKDECGAAGNRFRSKEDCEKICAGNLTISARQSHVSSDSINHIGISNPDCCSQNHCPNHTCPNHNCTNPPCPPRPCCHPCPHDHCPPCSSHPSNPCPHHRNCSNNSHNLGAFPLLQSSLCLNVHCPTVCSSSRLSPLIQSICCGCRTGTIIRSGTIVRSSCSSSHQHCHNNQCHNTTNNHCGTTTTTAAATTTTVAPIGPNPPPEIICPITEPSHECMGMLCPYGFKKSDAGCSYCECEEEPVIRGRGALLSGSNRFCNNIRATCRLNCPHGFVKNRHGCEVCQCSESGLEPTPVDCSLKPRCTMFCEHGFQKGRDGCEICRCNNSDPDKSHKRSHERFKIHRE